MQDDIQEDNEVLNVDILEDSNTDHELFNLKGETTIAPVCVEGCRKKHGFKNRIVFSKHNVQRLSGVVLLLSRRNEAIV